MICFITDICESIYRIAYSATLVSGRRQRIKRIPRIHFLWPGATFSVTMRVIERCCRKYGGVEASVAVSNVRLHSLALGWTTTSCTHGSSKSRGSKSSYTRVWHKAQPRVLQSRWGQQGVFLLIAFAFPWHPLQAAMLLPATAIATDMQSIARIVFCFSSFGYPWHPSALWRQTPGSLWYLRYYSWSRLRVHLTPLCRIVSAVSSTPPSRIRHFS